MSNEFLKQEMHFTLDTFTGPLDVLLSLIIKKKTTIQKLDIVMLTNQYLEFIEIHLNDLNIDQGSEYLAMASYLLNLKSKQALVDYQQLSQDSETIYEIEQLRQQLFLHNQYLESVNFLRNNQIKRLTKISKEQESLEELLPLKIIIKELPKLIKLENLIDAYKHILEKNKALQIRNKFKLTLNDIDVDAIQEEIVTFIDEEYFTKISFFNLLKLTNVKIDKEYIAIFFVSLLVLVKENGLKMFLENNEIMIEKFNGEDF